MPAEHAEPSRVLWPRKGAGHAPPQRAVLWECERSAWQCGLGAVAWLYGGCSPVEVRRDAEQVRQTQARWRGGTSGRHGTSETGPGNPTSYDEVRVFLP